MTDFYDREGRHIDISTWVKLFSDSDYKIIAVDEDETRLVSTIWLGMDGSWSWIAIPLRNFRDNGI